MIRKQTIKKSYYPGMLSVVLAAIMVIGLTAPVIAADKNEIDITRIGVGSAVMGKGGWYAGYTEGTYSALMNPAGIGQFTSLKATSMYTSFLKEYDYVLASGAVPCGKYGTFGLSYIGAYTDADQRRDIYGNPLGKMGYSDSLFMLSWGIPLRNLWRPHIGEDKMAIGASLKYYQKGFTGEAPTKNSASGLGLDLGYQYKINRWTNLGLVWKNVMLNRISWETGTYGNLPSSLKVGIAANVIGVDAPVIMGEQELIIGGDVDFSLNDENTMLYHIGAEYWPLEYLALRTGLDQTAHGNSADTNLTFGVGLAYGNISFDYAYHPYAGIPENDTHYFSLSYQSNKKDKNHYVQLFTPKDKFITLRDKLVISGMVIDPDVDKVLINEEKVELDKDRTFAKEIDLGLGKNRSQIIVVDEYGYVLEAIDLRQLRLTSFSDVTDSYWAALPIRQLATIGMINGYPDGGFKPEDKVTRAEATTLLAKARETKPIGKSVSLFNDVRSSHWANPYINGGFALGLVTGYPDGGFAPRKNITRAEGVTLITRFDGIKIPETIDESPYDDIAADHWAAPVVTMAKAAGLLTYLKSSRFEDKKLLTRAETIEILSRTEYVQNKLNDLYNWDSYVYQPKERIVVERKEIAADLDKLKIIDDTAEVEVKLVAAKKLKKERYAQEKALKFQPVMTEAEREINAVYDAYLPKQKKIEKKLAVAAIEFDTKTEPALVPQKLSETVVVRKVEAVKVETKVAAVPEEGVAEKKEETTTKKVFNTLKGALLGRWLASNDKDKDKGKGKPKADIYLHKAEAAETVKTVKTIETIETIEKSQYTDQVKMKLGPAPASTKLYIKCMVPAEANVTKITATIKENGDTVMMYKRTPTIWAGVYYIGINTEPGEHEVEFRLEAVKEVFPRITEVFTSR
ncbi:S-layer homology domain-containing protein [Candidatus Margulisiibacteriota bacterium]